MALQGQPSTVLSVTTQGTLPGQVTGLVLSNPGNTTMQVTGNNVTTGTGAIVYIVQYKLNTAIEWNEWPTPIYATDQYKPTGGTWTMTLTGLLQGNPYNVRAFARNAVGDGAFSTTQNLSTTGALAASTTWNPNDSNNNTFTNNNRTITSGAGTHSSVRATSAYATGKRYFEFIIAGTVTADIAVGFSTAAYDLVNAWLGFGSPSNGVGVWITDQHEFVLNNGWIGQQDGVMTTAGRVYFAVDFDADQWWFTTDAMRVNVGAGAWNNSTTANPSTGVGGITGIKAVLPGPYYPTVYTNHSGVQVTLNTGQDPAGITIPTNFTFADGSGAASSVTVPGVPTNFVVSLSTVTAGGGTGTTTTPVFADEFLIFAASATGSDHEWLTHYAFGGSERLLTANGELQYFWDIGGTYNPFSVSNGILTIKADKARADAPGLGGGTPIANPFNSFYNSGAAVSCIQVNGVPVVNPGLNVPTVLAGSGGSFSTSDGAVWTISPGGAVQRNGANWGFTANVARIVNVNNVVWHANTSNSWYFTDSAGNWTPGIDPVDKQGLFSIQYGFICARMLLPKGKGFWPAFWMMPADGGEGEIDIMEALGDDPFSVYCTLHFVGQVESVNHIPVRNLTDTSVNWHEYAVDWQADVMKFYVDRVLVGTMPTPTAMKKPYYLLFNLAVGGSWPGTPDNTTQFPAFMQIDYIRVYPNFAAAQGTTTQPSTTPAGASWATPTGSTPFNYQIEYKPTLNTTWLPGPSTQQLSVALGELAPARDQSVSYDFRVYATNNAGRGPATAPYTVTIPPWSVPVLRYRGFNQRWGDLTTQGMTALAGAVPNANAAIIPVNTSTANLTSTDLQIDTPLANVAAYIAAAKSAGFQVFVANYISCRDGSPIQNFTPGQTLIGCDTWFKNLAQVVTQIAATARDAGAVGLWVAVEAQPWAPLLGDPGPFTPMHMAQWKTVYTAAKSAWPAGVISYVANEATVGIVTPLSDFAMKWDFWDTIVFDIFPNIDPTYTTATTIEAAMDSQPDTDPFTQGATGTLSLWQAIDNYAKSSGRKVIINACGIVPAAGNQAMPEAINTRPPPYDYNMATEWWTAVMHEVSKRVGSVDGFFALSGSVNSAIGTLNTTDYYGTRGYNAASVINTTYGDLRGQGASGTIPAPASITFSNVTSTSFTVTWSAVVANNPQYILEYAPAGSSNWTPLPATSATTTNLAALSPASSYQVRVHAVAGTIVGATSTPQTVTTLAAGGTVTRQAIKQPGGQNSPWNKPINSGLAFLATTHPATIAARHANTINPPDFYGITRYVATASDPQFDFTGPLGGQTVTIRLHVPVGATTPGPWPGDNQFLIIDPINYPDRQWCFQGTGIRNLQAGQGPITFTGCEWNNIYGDEYGNDYDSLTKTGDLYKYGTDVGVGLITAYDLDPAQNPDWPIITHAIRFAHDAIYFKQNGTPNASDFLLAPSGWPDGHQDFQTPPNVYTGNLPFGYGLAIPFNTPQPAGLTQGGIILFESLRRYPAFPRDMGNGGFTPYMDQDAYNSPYRAGMVQDLPTIVNLLQVIDPASQHQGGQDYATHPINGTGTPLHKGPPPLASAPPTNTKQIVINPITQVAANTSFTVTGSTPNYTTIPVLNFKDDGGAAQSLPANAQVSQNSFAFTHAGMSGGASTGSTAGTTAARTEDLLGVIGINGHIARGDTAYNGTTQLVTDAQFVGTRHWREEIRATSGNATTALRGLVTAGITLIGLPPNNNQVNTNPFTLNIATMIGVLDTWRSWGSGVLFAIEGPNDPVNYPIIYGGLSGGGASGSWQAVANFQKDWFSQLKANTNYANTPVLTPTQVGAELDNVGLQFGTVYSSGGTAGNTVFADEFSVANITENGGPTSWMNSYAFYGAQYTLPFNNEAQYYTSSVRTPGFNPFSIVNGQLVITADKAIASAPGSGGGTPIANPLGLKYNSGAITSTIFTNGGPAPGGYFAGQYFYVEWRAKFPAGRGLWPALWLEPSNSPWAGEIDVMECVGDGFTIYQTVHGTGNTFQVLSPSNTSLASPQSMAINVGDYRQFHTYGFEWNASWMTFYVDGVATGRMATGSPFLSSDPEAPWYLLTNLAVGDVNSWPGLPDNTTQFPTSMTVDYVRVWRSFADSRSTAAASTINFADALAHKVYPEFDNNSVQVVDETGDRFLDALRGDFVTTFAHGFSGMTDAAAQAASRYITEYGVPTTKVDAATQGKNLLTAVMNAHDRGYKSLVVNQLYGDGYALFSAPGTPKAAATYLHNLATIIGETAAARKTFTPGKLNVTVSGLPATGHWKLLQKSDGTFYVVVWNNVKNYTIGGSAISVAASSVNVSFNATGHVKTYDPTIGTVAQTDTALTSSASLSLRDYPLIVEFVSTSTNTVTHRIDVFDTAAPTITTSASYQVGGASTGPSPDKTLILVNSGGQIIDNSSNVWTISANGKVAVNGVEDANTGNVIQMAWVSSLIWQYNTFGDWYSKPSGQTAPGGYSGPTKVDPITGQTPVTGGGGTAGTAANLLSYLTSLKGKGVISGQFLSHTGNLADMRLPNGIKSATGIDIGAIGGDYWYPSANPSLRNHDFNAVAKAWWQAGGLVHLSQHYPNPATGADAFTPGGDFTQLLTPGTAINNTFNGMIDWTISGIQDLNSVGCVPIMRLFHEMEGNWFWWGVVNTIDNAKYIAMWKYTVDRIRAANVQVLYFWCSNGNGMNTGRYPGDTYCDIVGWDEYNSNGVSTSAYNNHTAPGKVMMVGEFGPGLSPTDGWPETTLINTLRSNAPLVVAFQQWWDPWDMVRTSNLSQALNDAWVINRNKISIPVSTGSNVIVPPITGATSGTWISGTLNGQFWRVLLPHGYTSSKKYPVLLALHDNLQANGYYQGNSDTVVGPMWDGYLNTAQFRTDFPFIVVTPYCNQVGDTGSLVNFGGVTSTRQVSETNNIALLKAVLGQYSCDATNVVCLGIGMGANAAWAYAKRYNTLNGDDTANRLIRAIIPFDGNPFEYGSPSSAILNQLRSVPIWSTHGTLDTLIPPSWDQAMYQGYGGAWPGNRGKAPNGNMWSYNPAIGHGSQSDLPLPQGRDRFTWAFSKTGS